MKSNAKKREWFLYSHQRSGSHYICHMIAKHFYPKENYLAHYRNHQIGPEVRLEIESYPNTIFFFTWREMDPCLRSIWKLRERFGLEAASYEEFLNTPYQKMWREKKLTNPVVFNYLNSRGREYNVSYFFSSVPYSPVSWWTMTRDWWRNKEAKYPNVMTIKYDDFISNKRAVMNAIAKKLNQPPPPIIFDEKERIGWMLEEEAKANEGRMS